MKRRELLVTVQILTDLLKEKMPVASAVSISDCLIKMEPYQKAHARVMEERLKQIPKYSEYQQSIQDLQSIESSDLRQTKIKKLNAEYKETIQHLQELEAEFLPIFEEEVATEVEFSKITLPDTLELNASTVHVLKVVGLL
jgi:hypothetical protein